MEREYSAAIASAVRRFLEEDNWNFSFDRDQGLFRFGVSMSGRLKNVQYVVSVNRYDYNVYAISPVSADAEDAGQMAKMAEFITRINYGLKDGNFEMDFRDGELRYRCYVNSEGTVPTVEMVDESIRCPLMMYNRCSDAILQMLFYGMSARDAAALCEGNGIGPCAGEEKETEEGGEGVPEDEEGKEDEEDEKGGEEAAHLMEVLRGMLEETGEEGPARDDG